MVTDLSDMSKVLSSKLGVLPLPHWTRPRGATLRTGFLDNGGPSSSSTCPNALRMQPLWTQVTSGGSCGRTPSTSVTNAHVHLRWLDGARTSAWQG